MEKNDLIEAAERIEPIYKGKILTFHVDTVRLPSGSSATREYVRHNGAVAVVAVTDDGTILMEEQFRYPCGRVFFEIPAGKLDSKAEDHEAAALRELSEETGATCREISFIGELHTSPAILDEVIYMYVARGLDFGEQHPDDDEFLSVVRLPLKKAVEMIVSGEIKDAKTQAAILKTYFITEKKNEA